MQQRGLAGDHEGAARALESLAACLRRGSQGGLITSARLADTLERLGVAAMALGERDRALAAWTEAIALRRATAGQADGEASAGSLPLARALSQHGHVLCTLHRWDEARESLSEAAAMLDRRPAGEAAALAEDRIATLNVLAAAQRFSGRGAEALASLERGAALASEQARRSGDAEDRARLAQILNNLGRSQLELDRPAAARQTLERCAAILEALLAEGGDGGPGAGVYLRNLRAAALNQLGRSLAALGEMAAARLRMAESVEIMRGLVEREGCAALADDLEQARADLARLPAGGSA